MDTELSNNRRAEIADDMVITYSNQHGCHDGRETVMSDIISDFMHLASAAGLNWQEIIDRATNHYNAEVHELGAATSIGD
ncbi:MAG: hypothetical protein U5K75_02975 [Ahrensia sp.]|nr:hypothetical protein [Ahrensia sp.]